MLLKQQNTKPRSGNPASDRVLQKSGFRHEGTLRQRAWFKGAFHDFRMFGRIAGDPAE